MRTTEGGGMSEEKDFKTLEPDDGRMLETDEGDDVEGHGRVLPGGKQISRSEDAEDADVEGHFKQTPFKSL
jgi:hypothetical protein